MKQIKLKGLEEVVYKDKCRNGLEIYVWVNEKVNTFKGAYVVKAGAEDIFFQVGKKLKELPYGTAHYLEHMMCKKSDGSSLLDAFNELGCYSNASTYPDKTVYEFVGAVNLMENLGLLLDSIQKKEWTKKAFELERGTIIEEARMRKDDVSRITTYGINNCLFWAYPNRVIGLGNIEDIENMKVEDLETFYEAYYHPKNSFIIVTGNVNPKEVIEFIKENQNKKEFSSFKRPKKLKYEEKDSIVTDYKEVSANIEIPKIILSVKIRKDAFEDIEDDLLLDMINVVLSSNFGVTSLFREKVFENNLAITLGSSAYFEKDYIVVQVRAETKNKEELIPLLKEKLESLEIDEQDIKRKVKSEIANMVLSYEDPESVSDMLTYYLVKYGHILENEKEILESINIKDIQNVFKKISMNEMNTFVVLPRK